MGSEMCIRDSSSRALLLSDEAKSALRGYAADAEQAWLENGAAGVEHWIAAIRDREPGDIMVVSQDDQSLSGIPLTESERAGLRFQRGLEWRMTFFASSLSNRARLLRVRLSQSLSVTVQTTVTINSNASRHNRECRRSITSSR